MDEDQHAVVDQNNRLLSWIHMYFQKHIIDGATAFILLSRKKQHLLSKKNLRKFRKSMIILNVNVHQFAEPRDTMYFSYF